MRSGRASLLLAVGILLAADAFGNPVGNSTNETDIEGDFLEDALDKWLGNFDTYTLMVELDVDDDDSDAAVGAEEELVGEESPIPEEEEVEEDYDQGSSAPITLSIKTAGSLLLNSHSDYKVKIESLVAEGGSVLVTLGSFGNKTRCGIGGFSLPPEAAGRVDPEGRLNISHQMDGDRSTTFVTFAVDTTEENYTSSTTTWMMGDKDSAWEDRSQNLWWVMGRLAGGGILTLIYTPPECGCLTLKAHYALPVGDNLTLVVGPEAYPSDLEKLLCVDPASHSIQENLIGHEDKDEDAFGGSDILHESDQDLLDPSVASMLDPSVASMLSGRAHGRWVAKKQMRLDRKKKRQEARQAIRQAGRRITWRRLRKHMRLQRKDSEAKQETETRKANPRTGKQAVRKSRKQARKTARKQVRKNRQHWKGKKPWKKQRKHARKNWRKNKHGRRNMHIRNHNVTDVSQSLEEILEDQEDQVNDDYLNTTQPQTEEDVLADILLAEEEGDEGGGGGGGDGDPVAIPIAVTDGPVSTGGQKRRRQKESAKKCRNAKRKGSKFCCKQGIKYKKSLLLNETAAGGEPDLLCNNINDVIFTFASHNFGVESLQCSLRFKTCCSKFNHELWEKVKSTKAAKKAKRKEQRKTKRQQKKWQSRQQKRFTTLVPSTTR